MIGSLLGPKVSERVLERLADLVSHGALTSWQLRQLQHTCSPNLRCEAPQVNVTCPEPPRCSGCEYYILVNQWLWALVTGLVALVVCLLAGTACWCLKRRGPARAASGKGQALALKEKYGATQPR